MENQLITFQTAKLAKSKGFTLLWDDTKQYSWDALDSQGLFEEKWYDEKGQLNAILYSLEEGLDNYITKENIDTTYLAATQSFLQKWLREKHKINISMINGSNTFNLYYYEINMLNKFPIKGDGSKNYTYEEALEEGLCEALKLI